VRVPVDEFEVRRNVDQYRSMLATETNERRRNALLELLQQEQLKLSAIELSRRSDQDN
jgi:hypothetical protein